MIAAILRAVAALRRRDDRTDAAIRAGRERLRPLGLPEGAGIAGAVDRVSELRGRPIRLVPLEMGSPGPCGIFLEMPGVDYICYEKQTSRHHQDHIIAHEIGHIICSHQGRRTLGDARWAELLPDLDPDLIRTLLGRSGYSPREELDAEVIATLIVGSGTAGAPGILGRLETSLGFRQLW